MTGRQRHRAAPVDPPKPARRAACIDCDEWPGVCHCWPKAKTRIAKRRDYLRRLRAELSGELTQASERELWLAMADRLSRVRDVDAELRGLALAMGDDG